MTALHTPGPWFAFTADYQRQDHELGPVFTVGPEEFHTVAQVRPGCEDDGLPEQTAANGRLIAAAPDLLAALQAAEEIFQSGEFFAPAGLWDRVQDMRRAAIAKALGEAA